MKLTQMTTIAASFGLAVSVAHAESWDMPMAYAATNFHSEHGQIFADKVKEYTAGDLEITIHPGGSLFKGGEIKRAVQTGQAPIGERFMSAHANEAPILGWDNLPFLATSYEDNEKLWGVAKDRVNAALSEQNLVVLYTCPCRTEPGTSNWCRRGVYFFWFDRI
jgi:TRAP-type C4-dicarboxylate transport system substrate-binding protein